MKTSFCILLIVVAVSVSATGYGGRRESRRGGYGEERREGYGNEFEEFENGFFGGGFEGKSRFGGGYGRGESRFENERGYGRESRKDGGYGGESRKEYEEENGEVEYKVKYEIGLPEDKHDSSADWEVEQDNRDSHYSLEQTHPYGARSRVYLSTQNEH